jgi:hypothetical protein
VDARRDISLAALNDRTLCPRCGSRRVNLIFEPPTIAGRAGGYRLVTDP